MSIKKAVKIPVIVVGGITKLENIEDIINNDRRDVVSMLRPYERESCDQILRNDIKYNEMR